jgi:GNAT superfamily N-acetyltransferase
MGGKVTISTDKSRLDVVAVHRYLSEKSYWAAGRTVETVRQTIDHSLCFGMYGPDNKLLGFARVVTDHAVFAYLMDVFILEEHRGKGLGKKLVEHIIAFPALKHISRWMLATADAHGLYEKFGFGALAAPEKHMEKVDGQRSQTHRAVATTER